MDFAFGRDLETIDVGEFRPKETSMTEGQVEASVSVYSSNDGKMDVGVWECTPGRFTADRTQASEVCHFLSGEVEMTHADGRKQTLKKGDVLVLPKGWRGEWRILRRTRKLYVISS